mgnify:CR=1 FL=1
MKEKNIKLRIKFRKFGPLRFIGHLDVMRFFQKAIRRAEIDVAYTGGFSPHQVMTFAAPLGVGLESNGEYMDIEVCSLTSCQDILDRLNGASVPGIEVVSVKVLPDTAGNAMASVAAAAYTVAFRQGREPRTDIARALPGFLAKEKIPYTKETKKGCRELDLKPGIYELTYSEAENDKTGMSFLAGKPFFHEKSFFHMLLDASSAGNIKPGQVIEAFLSENGEVLQENALLITREELYTNIGTEEEPRLVALSDICNEEDIFMDKRYST